MEKFFTEWERIEFLIIKASKKTKPTQQSNTIALLSEAIERIKNLPDANSRIYRLIRVAETYQDLNLKMRSLEVFEQALSAIENCEYDSIRATNLGEIGYQYVKLGQTSKGFELLETALKLATNLEDIDSRDLTLCDIARNYADLGQIDIALEIARLVQDEYRVIIRILQPLKIEPSTFFRST